MPTAAPTPTPEPDPGTLPSDTVQIINSAGRANTFYVEIASTSAAINRGLMYRTSLGQRSGMLFLMGGSGYHTFTMANMNFALDIIFIDSDYHIVHIAANVQPGQTGISSSAPCTYVLEINGGLCSSLGISEGDRVRIGPYSDPDPTPTPAPTPTPTPTPSVKPPAGKDDDSGNSATPTPAPTTAPAATAVPSATQRPSATPRPTVPFSLQAANATATPLPLPTGMPILSDRANDTVPASTPEPTQAAEERRPARAGFLPIPGMGIVASLAGLVTVVAFRRLLKK